MRQLQRVGPAFVAFRREAVLFEQVEDRDRALVLDVGVGAADRVFVERDLDQTVRRSPLAGSRLICGLRRIATERACAVEAFGVAERHGGGRERAQRSARSLRMEVRFMKSSTPRPEEKRAERAVGSTWLEPAT